MASLNILNRFSVVGTGAVEHSGKQGAVADGVNDELVVTVSGDVHQVSGTLATAAVRTVYDNDDDAPTSWNYLWFWCSVDMYLQIILATGNLIHKVLATTPFNMSWPSALVAANTTVIAGGVEPTLEAVDSIVIGNYSGGSGTFNFAVVD